MKTLNTLVLSILFVGSAVAQNWSPVLTSQILHYKADTTQSSISHTITIDSSIALTATDTVFYLNRIADISTGVCNQPQFLGLAFVKHNYGIFSFGSIDRQINSLSHLGDVWQVNTSGSLTAIISSESDTIIWGVADSVKTISFSNGETWLLSKNHGLIYVEGLDGIHYSLFGIENIGGRHLPTLNEDFYDWNVGDIFYYQGEAQCCPALNGTFQVEVRRDKMNVLQKTVAGDSVIYLIDRIKAHGYGNSSYYPSTLSVHRDTFTRIIQLKENVVLSDFRFAVGGNPFYNNSLQKIDYVGNDTIDIDWSTPVTFLEENGQFLVYTSLHNSFTTPPYTCNGSVLGTTTFQVNESFFILYQEGIGLKHSSFSGFEYVKDYQLISCVISGDTLFNSMISDIAMGVEQKSSKGIVFLLFPNPATTQITVETPIENLSDGKIVLYDLVGRAVLSVPVSGEQTTFSVEDSPAGMYFLTVYEKGIAIKTEKLIITRE